MRFDCANSFVSSSRKAVLMRLVQIKQSQEDKFQEVQEHLQDSSATIR